MGQAAGKPLQLAAMWRKLVAEAFGTFLLTVVATGAEVIDALSGHDLGHVAKTVAPGLLIMAMIYALGEVSGAHFNPAVTLGFALHRAFPWRIVPAYWLAQITGAILAGAFLRVVFGAVAVVGVPTPGAHFSDGQALVMEIVLTGILVTIILGTAQEARLIGPNAGIAVGGTIALCGLFASPVSRAAMNPALALGPALITLHLATIWLYLIGPALGSAIAVAICYLLHGPPQPIEEHKAQGGGKE